MNIKYLDNDAQPATRVNDNDFAATLMLLTLSLIAGAFLAANTGCSTLAALGLPVSAGPNQLAKSAREISESVGHAAPIARELNETTLATYLVEPGDTLYVEAADFESPVRLPGDQPVQPDGTINLGEYGRYPAVGKSMRTIRREVQALIESKEPKSGPITVRLISWESKQFYVLGEVNSPGAFQFDGNETVLDGILEAGGLNTKANQHRIILSRPTYPNGCRIVLPICYKQITQLGDTSTNYQLMPGDRIFVASISLLDDIRDSFFPFCERNCPRCACPPVGCDPCSLPSLPYAYPEIDEEAYLVAPSLGTQDELTDSVTAPILDDSLKKQLEQNPEESLRRSVERKLDRELDKEVGNNLDKLQGDVPVVQVESEPLKAPATKEKPDGK